MQPVNQIAHVTGSLWEKMPPWVNEMDLKAFHMVRGIFNENSTFWQLVDYLTHEPAGIASFYLALFLLWSFRQKKNLPALNTKTLFKNLGLTFFTLILFFGLSELVCNMWLKELFGKLKPGMYPYNPSPLIRYSFPSAHAFNTAFMTSLLVFGLWRMGYEKWFRFVWPAVGLSVFVAFSRMVFGEHFISDVVAGLVLGELLALMCVPLWVGVYRKIWGKAQTPSKPTKLHLVE